MIRRITYRFILPAVLLLATLVWFSDRLRLLPARDKITKYVKQHSVIPDNFLWTSDGTTTSSTQKEITTTTTATSGGSDASAATSSPFRDVVNAIIADVTDKIVVMGALDSEDTTWVSRKLPDWQRAIYAVQDSNPAHLHAPNKGHEASPYLTYIIEHYDNLPSTIAFIHSHEEAWHTDAVHGSNVASLRMLNIPFVQRAGYANLRCVAKPGCPNEIQPFRVPPRTDGGPEQMFGEAWRAVFNDTRVPEIVAVPCCAQFAVSRAQVRQRPREFYVRARQWLLDSTLDDPTSGRIFEYLWHIIFGRDPVHCPALKQCYKDVYNKMYLDFTFASDD